MSLAAAKMRSFCKLKALLEPFGLTRYYTDYWGAYTRHLDPEQHTVQANATRRKSSASI